MHSRELITRFGVCLLVAAVMIAAHHAGICRSVENQILSVFSAGEQWSEHVHPAALR